MRTRKPITHTVGDEIINRPFADALRPLQVSAHPQRFSGGVA